MRLPEAALGSVCGFVTLLPILLPFFLGVPAPTAEHCWMAEPFVDSEALFGYPLMEINDNFGLLFALYVLANAVSSLGVLMSGRICIKLVRAGDYRAGRYRQYLRSLLAYFVAQLILNFAIAVSFVDNRCGYHNVDQRGTCTHGTHNKPIAPPRALLEHILDRTGINCLDGNQYCDSFGGDEGARGDCCAPFGEAKLCKQGHPLTLLDVGCWDSSEGLFACCDVGGEIETNWTSSGNGSNPGSVYMGRLSYLLFTFLGGVLTNVMLEMVLVHKARMIAQGGGGGAQQCFVRCFMRCVGCLIILQTILLLVLGGLCLSAFIALLCLSGGDSQDEGEGNTGAITTTAIILYPMGFFTLVHAFVSIGICVVFVRLVCAMERRDKREALSASAAPFSGAGDTRAVAGPDERAGGPKAGELRRAKLVRRVAIATVLSVSSTLICYATVMSLFIEEWDIPLNFIAMLALDSIINDLCLLWVAVTSESDDAANAQEAEMQNLSSALGFVSEPAAGSASAAAQQTTQQQTV